MTNITINRENRNFELENQRNLHIGKPYRAQIQTCVYDGLMTNVTANFDNQGFTLLNFNLENGLFYHSGDPSQKFPFDKVKLGSMELSRMSLFGRILDEQGFFKAIDRRKAE